MTYRDRAVAACKMAGEELVQRAEELIADTESIKGVDIWIRIPSLSDDPCCIPELQVTTNVYPKRINIYKLIEETAKMADDASNASESV